MNPTLTQQSEHMNTALKEAQKALLIDEVPVGAVIVDSLGNILAKAHNLKEQNFDPCGHAELLAIKLATEKIGSWRLTGCSLYVTLEPCMMCVGAIVHSRIENLFFGAFDPKSGFVKSVAEGFALPHNHIPKWKGGVLKDECSIILKNFFRMKRAQNNTKDKDS